MARRILLAFVLISAALTSPIAEAGCAGTTCGAICQDTYDTIACKPVASAGCMSMTSLTCCPRIPRE